MLTGDHAGRGRAIEQELGVKVEAELLPAQKVAAIENLKKRSGRCVWSATASMTRRRLAASDVGMALGCGADVSRDSASVCLLGDDLSRIPWCIELARRTRRVIRWNLIWAFGYNSVGVACAAVGLLNPALAAFLMVASSALVTINSLRLGRPFDVELPELVDGPRRTRPGTRSFGCAVHGLTSPIGVPSPRGAATRAGGRPAMIELPLVFLGGLLGSAHCVGMCGGFAVSIGLGVAELRRQFVAASDLHCRSDFHLLVLRSCRRLREASGLPVEPACGSTPRRRSRWSRACFWRVKGCWLWA